MIAALPLLVSLAFLAGRAWGWSVERGLREELGWTQHRIDSLDKLVAVKERWRSVARRLAERRAW